MVVVADVLLVEEMAGLTKVHGGTVHSQNDSLFKGIANLVEEERLSC